MQDDPNQTDYRPVSGKAEIHVTYRCTLACRFCNRYSFLREPHTPDMTVAGVAEFLRQARELQWYPALLLIGGEPTIHPDIDEICRMCVAFGKEAVNRNLGFPEKGLRGLVQIWSNQTTPEAADKCRTLYQKYRIAVIAQTIKVRGTIPIQVGQHGDSERYEFDIQDVCVSPHDLGLGTRPHCWQHSCEICGISVDAGGYTLCAVGGAVDGMLGLGIRTKRLADLFDVEAAARHTGEMCKHCGSCLSRTGIRNGEPGRPVIVSPEGFRELANAQPKWRGMPVTPTWMSAFESHSE